MTGDAANLLWAQPTADEIEYVELERLLRDRFGSADQEEKFKTELRARRRGKDHSLQALHADVIRLMALAYPKDHTPLSRRIARDYFLTALGDPELEIKIREREPPELQAAYKTAIRLETLKKASNTWEMEAVVAQKNVVKPTKATRAVQELADQLNLEAVKEELMKQMSDWKVEKQREIE